MDRIAMRHVVLASLAVAVGCACAPARAVAVNCSGFQDVAPDATYCAAVTWLKARSITVGCSDTSHYCPDQAVTRASMASFMKRLGVALAPQFLHQAEVFDGSASGVYCKTPNQSVGDYNRYATGSAMFYAEATSGQQVLVKLVYSTDGGLGWNNWSQYVTPMVAPVLGYVAAPSVAAPLLLQNGQSVMFGVQYATASGGVVGGCELTVRIENSNDLILE